MVQQSFRRQEEELTACLPGADFEDPPEQGPHPFQPSRLPRLAARLRLQVRKDFIRCCCPRISLESRLKECVHGRQEGRDHPSQVRIEQRRSRKVRVELIIENRRSVRVLRIIFRAAKGTHDGAHGVDELEVGAVRRRRGIVGVEEGVERGEERGGMLNAEGR